MEKFKPAFNGQGRINVASYSDVRDANEMVTRMSAITQLLHR